MDPNGLQKRTGLGRVQIMSLLDESKPLLAEHLGRSDRICSRTDSGYPEIDKFVATEGAGKIPDPSSRPLHICDDNIGESSADGSTGNDSLKDEEEVQGPKASTIDVEGNPRRQREIVILMPKSTEADELKLWMKMDSSVDDGSIVSTAEYRSTKYFLWENFSRDEDKNNEYMLYLRLFLEKRHNCYIVFMLPRRPRNGDSITCLNRVKQMFVEPMQHKIRSFKLDDEPVWSNRFRVAYASGRVTGEHIVSDEDLIRLFPCGPDYLFDRITGFKNNMCTIC